MLKLKNFSSKINGKVILENIDFEIKKKEIVVILGKNGSGKSTLLNSIIGNENFKTFGEIYFEKKDITKLDIEKRAKLQIFFSHQNPIEISGITFLNFLKLTYQNFKNKKIGTSSFIKLLDEKIKDFGFDKTFRSRFLNVGFSGGEKKKSELLQLYLVEPKLALLDEIDSGLDLNGINLTNNIIQNLTTKNGTSFIIISHNIVNIEKLKPNKIYLLKNKKLNLIDYSEFEKIKTKGF